MPEVDGVHYTLRHSQRAKRVILKISVTRGLQVVIPDGFDLSRLPKALDSRKAWIERELKQVNRMRALLTPNRIDLQAIGERWQVSYRSDFSKTLTTNEVGDSLIIVQGDTGDVYGVAAALRRWLHLKARAHLAPWLRGVSEEIGVSFKKTIIRGQTTRWASCSRLDTISLNRSLLFLPNDLVRHIFLHELCHIKRLDHSPEFWRLLGRLEPKYNNREAETRRADRHVPIWAHPG